MVARVVVRDSTAIVPLLCIVEDLNAFTAKYESAEMPLTLGRIARTHGQSRLYSTTSDELSHTHTVDLYMYFVQDATTPSYTSGTRRTQHLDNPKKRSDSLSPCEGL